MKYSHKLGADTKVVEKLKSDALSEKGLSLVGLSTSTMSTIRKSTKTLRHTETIDYITSKLAGLFPSEG